MTATRDAVKTEIESLADGWLVVAALIRVEHGPSCPNHAAWARRAEVLERAASGDGSARDPSGLRARNGVRLRRMSALTNPPEGEHAWLRSSPRT